MTYEEQAEAWIRSSPVAVITIGRFTLKFKLVADQDWGWGWGWFRPNDFDDTPEDKYLRETCSDMYESWHDLEFIDGLIDAMQKKPFNQGE